MGLGKLMRVYNDVVKEDESWRITKADLGLDLSLDLYGYPSESWKSDIKHFFQVKKLMERRIDLGKKKESLRELYSEEKKTLAAIEELMKGL